MVAESGADGLTLAKLGEAVGVKAASLYHHVQNKTDLLQAVNTLTVDRLFTAVAVAVGTKSDPADALQTASMAIRVFAHAHPTQYALAFADLSPQSRAAASQREARALPLQAYIAALTGEERALTALRGLWALVHGFVLLELNRQFERGGDLEHDFAEAVAIYLRGVALPSED